MIKRYRHILLLLMSICSPLLHADITRLNDISGLKTHLEALNEHDLVIFDIDDVVIQPLDQIFHPHNKNELTKYYAELQSKVSQKQMNDLLSIVNIQQEVRLVDPNIKEIFALLQKRLIPTVALTHCGTGEFGKIRDVADWRITQLNKVGINFEDLSPYIDFVYGNLQGKHGTAMFQSGILFTGYVDKGEVLREFLQSNKISPRTIIFIDDKINNLQSVEQALTPYDVVFIGFEYTAVAEQKNDGINLSTTELQFHILAEKSRWISDVEITNS